MNRENDCPKRNIYKIVMTVMLFAGLLIGATTYGFLNTNNSKHVSANVELMSVMSISEEQPLMLEASISRMMVPETTITPKVMLDEEEVPLAIEIKAMSTVQPKEMEKPLAKETVNAEEKEMVPEEVNVETKSSEGFVYNDEIPLPKDHQKYLYGLSKERGLDYEKTLAVIQHESVYDANVVSSTNDYGYFQINKVNHKDLSNKLDTPNDPLDPYVNINWGTYMLSDLYDHWEEKGISGEKLDEYVWSSYNKGLGGFRKYGKATSYIEKVREALTDVHAVM